MMAYGLDLLSSSIILTFFSGSTTMSSGFESNIFGSGFLNKKKYIEPEANIIKPSIINRIINFFCLFFLLVIVLHLLINNNIFFDIIQFFLYDFDRRDNFMKRKKILVYLASALVPVLIFLGCATLNKFLPFGNELLNSYDSFTQYPGILLEYARLIRNGNIFYSWGAGLGFNFFGTITYYGMSPLNLLSLLANPENYHMFIALMTLLRFGLLGLSMCFYLDHKKIKPLYVVLFSTTYALMGYTATYYYNYIWIDSIIMLPIVIYGLDKLIEGKSPCAYIFSLAFTIIINYYIGYMICIFSLIWFIYKVIFLKEKKKAIKTFIISSLIAGSISAIVLLPSMFALLAGKAELYNSVNYLGINRNILSILYTFSIGSYQMGDQMYGPAVVYSSILVLVLTVFYFFNKNISKKEKIVTLAIIIFFYLSFSVNILNFAWQFFQRPIWWQSRFAFTFVFFLITLAANTLTNIEYTDFKVKHRMIVLGILIVGMLIGAYAKLQVANVTIQGYTYFFLGFSIMILIEEMFVLDKKGFITMLVIFTFVELSINTFNSLKSNYRYMSYTDYQYLKTEIPRLVEKLDSENEYFYRMELDDEYSSNGGLFFGYNGLNYFNSARNIRVINFIDKLGLKVADKCHISLSELDPLVLSILNIKYIYGEEVEYLDKKESRVYENKYPLGIGFMVNSNVANLKLDSEDGILNRNKILGTMEGSDEVYYEKVSSDKFKRKEEDYNTTFEYNFISDGHYMILFSNFGGKIEINGKDEIIGITREIKRGDKVKIKYSIASKFEEEDVFIRLLNLDKYEATMKKLSENVYKAHEYVNGHIIEGTVEVSESRDFLFTSIEYEKGMKIFVDDKEVEPDLVFGTLIGLKLEPGNHKIYIDYVPKGFRSGLVITVLGLATAVAYLQIRRKTL
ncbi:MAG TPA: hypothetical protein DCY94_03060 [Firmicutes bacterium]|nr:hypothetical protein [Bacillota bacterium]